MSSKSSHRRWKKKAAIATPVGALVSIFLILCLSPFAFPEATSAETNKITSEDLPAMLAEEWMDEGTSPLQESEPNPHELTTSMDAAGGCDGIKDGTYGFHVASGEKDPWWQVDLGRCRALDRIVVYNRTDRGLAPRTAHLQILVKRKPEEKFHQVHQHDGTTFYGAPQDAPLVVSLKERGVEARFVRLAVEGTCSLALDEIEVYPTDDPRKNIALGQPADQISLSPYSTDSLGEKADSSASYSLRKTRQVLEKAEQLADRIAPGADAEKLAPLQEELRKFKARVPAEKNVSVPAEKRKEWFLRAKQLARNIAFANPLLDFDQILFIKRHHPTGPYHMCDQFYGCNAVAGGELCVLIAPFSSHPRVENLLADSVVENGRLAGKKLIGGAFLSPELSFDGKEILFAYSECRATETYQWFPECSFHLFKCNLDGSNLVQLTDGPTNDFDPCYLPDGRIAFISERRGGYLRCGRHCPVYTLFSMEPDGSDIVPLSYHETHEWQPSVDNNGMLVYTRWDYVDRDTNVAHHIWHCYPDGRDPRSYHGNYPARREARPWMEMDIRAIPGSSRYVATAGAHHGNALGSLVMIDIDQEDDGAMSQLEVITPDCPFPESSGRGSIREHSRYGTPWPLSENDYLCMYDRRAKHHGIYWIDADGNRELLYRDPEIPCFSPIPLRPRPVPPAIPSRTVQTKKEIAEHDGKIPPSTVAIMDIYTSDFAWPPETKIEELRIIQLLPKSTPPPNEPRIGVADQTNARSVLGTVPAEEDGSVFFECPAEKPIYFQAIDGRGQAVMSMRSATYLHPGEQLTCLGCHEPKRRGPLRLKTVPTALQRAPSAIRPEVEGSRPFSYVQLVQPVLEKHCVDCHREEKALDLSGTPEGPHRWSRSYTNLAGKYGFYFNVRNGSINDGIHGGVRTIPGRFGAKAAPLRDYLTEDHYGVQLSPDDLHRIDLWLDCNSEFYGAYEKTEAQSLGETVYPSLE